MPISAGSRADGCSMSRLHARMHVRTLPLHDSITMRCSHFELRGHILSYEVRMMSLRRHEVLRGTKIRDSNATEHHLVTAKKDLCNENESLGVLVLFHIAPNHRHVPDKKLFCKNRNRKFGLRSNCKSDEAVSIHGGRTNRASTVQVCSGTR